MLKGPLEEKYLLKLADAFTFLNFHIDYLVV